MNGREILVDTNIIFYLLNGSNELEHLLQGKDVFISFVTELELVGYNTLIDEEQRIDELLSDCTIISLNSSIKQQFKKLRKKHKLKLADTIIAATAIVFDLPLVTADKHFKSIEGLTVISYQPSAKPAEFGEENPLL